MAYPIPQTAAQLTLAEFKAFATAHAYPHPQQLPAALARLRDPYPVAAATTVEVYAGEAQQLATLLLEIIGARNERERAIHRLFPQHPDRVICESLPGAGDILAPALLAKFGDDRQRFPTAAASVQALAGTCPVTDKSGKRRIIKFRTACDMRFVMWLNSGQGPRANTRRGHMDIGRRSGHTASPIATQIAVWRTAGWRLCGNCGKPASPTTKPITCSRGSNGASRMGNQVEYPHLE